MSRRALLVLCLALMAAACSGDDAEVVSDTRPSSGGDGTIPADAECEALQVLLKLDLSDEERARVTEKVEAVDGVTATRLQAAAGDEEPTVLLVATESEEAASAVNEALSGDLGVVSVVHPEQVC